MLCPVRKDSEGNAEEPNIAELNSICGDPQKILPTKRAVAGSGELFESRRPIGRGKSENAAVKSSHG